MKVIMLIADGASARTPIIGPAAVWVEGAFGSGTVTLSASRQATGGNEISVGTFTVPSVFLDTIPGPHFLKASIAGSTNPSVTVR
jgi:hypothetical protein